tara:strand:- start:1886 stop:2413 length:528 start_codon:yes stop_codon:yes gene_type:complete
MEGKIQQFQMDFMEIIDDIADDIPNDKYMKLCEKMKDNYEEIEIIQNKIKDIESRDELKIIDNLKERNDELLHESKMARRYACITREFLEALEIHDIFREGAIKLVESPVDENGDSLFKQVVDIRGIKKQIDSVYYDKMPHTASNDLDYEIKYKKLVDRIKDTSKNQLQKLKNEL